VAGRLEGKVAIISGGARGMGAAEARLFAAEGALVLIGDVLDDTGRQTSQEIGTRTAFVHLDVTLASDWAAAVQWCSEHFGPPTVLVNNAGIIGRLAPIEDIDEESFRRVLDVNLIGTFLGTRAVIPAMTTAGGGSIINVSSTAGFLGAPGRSAYTASKFAIRGFTKASALELGKYNIRVNSIHPGSIDTEMLRRPPGTRFAYQAIDRIGQADEIARLALFVASDEASFSTGSEFVADGGFLAGSPSGAGPAKSLEGFDDDEIV
jgi:3alpha(or 20beta)-hydroxysteroid dehydrogenase